MEKLFTKDNVCGMINSGELALSFIHNVKEQSFNELKDIHKSTTEDFVNNGEANEIEKNKEFLGIGLDASKSFLINCYNQAVLNDITKSMSNDEMQKTAEQARDDIERNIENCKKNIFENHIESYFKAPENFALDHPESDQYQMRFTTSKENGAILNDFFNMQEVKDNDGNIIEKLNFNYDNQTGEFKFKNTDDFNFYAVKDIINNNTKDLISETDRNNILNSLTENYKKEHAEWFTVMEMAKSENITNLSSSNLQEFMKGKFGFGENDQMYDRIMGLGDFSPDKGSFGNIIKYHDMFDYTDGVGGINEWDLDNQILKKLYNTDVSFIGSDGKLNKIFEEFQVIDGNLNKLEYKFLSMEAFEKIKATGLFESNKKLEDSFREICKFCDADRKMIHFRSHENFKKMLTRLSGMKQMANEYKQYASPLKPVKAGMKAYSVATGGVSASYKLMNYVGRLKETQKYKKAYKIFLADKSKVNEAALEEAKKQLKRAISRHNLSERRLEKILHPLRAGKEYVFNKVALVMSNNKVIGIVTLRPVRDKAKKLIADRIYAPIGRIFNKPLFMLMEIFKPILISFAIFLALFLIIFLVCLGGISSTSMVGIIGVTPLAEYDHFDAMQKKYDELDTKFLTSIENRFLNYADTKNLKGENIYYGVNGQNNETYMINDDYENGIHYSYVVDDKHYGRTSNIEDLISMTAIMLSQQISVFPEFALGNLEWLYNLSHKYYYSETPLYACDSGCHKINYHCYDHFHDYLDTDIKYDPFHVNNFSGGDYEIRIANNSCEVCSQFFDRGTYPVFYGAGFSSGCVVIRSGDHKPENCYGCVSHERCFHGDGSGNMGRNKSECLKFCSDFYANYECPGHEHSDGKGGTYTTYCSGELGCEGWYQCESHAHYTCDGHEYKCCLGHTDINANINIKFYNELKETVNRYKFSDNDYVYTLLNESEDNIYEIKEEMEY